MLTYKFQIIIIISIKKVKKKIFSKKILYIYINYKYTYIFLCVCLCLSINQFSKLKDKIQRKVQNIILKNMNKNLQKQRMNIELNQIKSILNDFRRTKYKCIEVAKLIGVQMPKEEHFKNIQKATLRKMDLLDITGLVNLKNQLVRGLTELFQIERELRYKKQKFQARRQIMQAQTEQRQYIQKNHVQSAITSPRDRNIQTFQNNIKSIVIQPKKQLIPQISQQKPKNKNLQIPLYRSKNQSNQNKLDRISKYIASLKRNMKLNSQTLGYKWKIKEFLLEDQNYLQLRNQLEMFMMRQEELDNIVAKAVEKGIKEYVKKSEIVEANQEYKLIKIYKNKKENVKTQTNDRNTNQSSNPVKDQLVNHKPLQSPDTTFNFSDLKSHNTSFTQKTIQPPQPLVYNSPRQQKQQQKPTNLFTSPFIRQTRFTSPLKKLSKIQIQQKAQQDFNSIKKQLQKSNQSYNEMISKINQTVEKGSQKLIQLREKRKKKFQKDDDIWDQLDKI